MQEIWKDIKGFEGCYQISNFGNVKSLQRETRSWNGNAMCTRIIKEKLLKPLYTRGSANPDPSKKRGDNNYMQVALRRYQDKAKMHRIHRLVAEHFVPNPDSKPIVNHIDGDKFNNHWSNLEWVDNSESQKHMYEIGLREVRTYGQHHQAKPVLQYDLNGNFIAEYDCAKSAAEAMGVSSSAITGAASGKRKTSCGFAWKYKQQ